MSVASCPFSCPCLSRNHPAKREAPVCSPLPAPCQVEIVQLEGFKTCAKHVPPGPETLPCSFSLCQRFARSYLAFRRFHPRTRNPPVHLSPFAFALPSQNIAFRGFQNLREARSTRAPNPSVQLQGRILHLDSFHTCARHVSLGHETLLCTFRPLPLPCQVEILHFKRVSKPARSTFHQGPKPFRAALALCQRFARSNIAFRRFPHLHWDTNPPVHLSPFAPAPALPSRTSAFRGFQNLREARSTRAPNPSVQL